MHKIWEETGSSLGMASEQMKHFYDHHRKDVTDYKVGDKVLLESYNLQTNRPSKKLDNKCYGPFTITTKVGAATYKLQLPKTWKSIWPVFNKLLLTPYKSPHYEQQQKTPPQPPEIVDRQEEYEIDEIHNSKLYRGKLRYLVQWYGYLERHLWMWEPSQNLKNTQKKVQQFHKKHLNAPQPIQLSSLSFTPVPKNKYTKINITNIHSWIDGKKFTNPWDSERSEIATIQAMPEVSTNISTDINAPGPVPTQGTWEAAPIDNWNTTNDNQPSTSSSNNPWGSIDTSTPWDYLILKNPKTEEKP